MRLTIVCGKEDIEVIADEFAIDGTTEKFAVHPSLGGLFPWVATHVASTFSIGHGDTIDGAIVDGTEKWLCAPPERRDAAIKKAMAQIDALMVERAKVPA